MGKRILSLIALASIGAFTSTVHAQIIWSAPSAITGYGDIATNGTFIDAITPHSIVTYGATAQPATLTIGDSIFKINTKSDSTFSFSTSLGDGTDGTGPDGLSAYNTGATKPASTAEANYNEILTRCAYYAGTETVTLKGLTADQYYQVQIWDSTPRSTTYVSGSNSVTLVNQFALGTFLATGTTQTFTYAPTPINGNTLGIITDIELRAVPEPSTYGAMVLGIVALAGAMRLRKLAA